MDMYKIGYRTVFDYFCPRFRGVCVSTLNVSGDSVTINIHTVSLQHNVSETGSVSVSRPKRTGVFYSASLNHRTSRRLYAPPAVQPTVYLRSVWFGMYVTELHAPGPYGLTIYTSITWRSRLQSAGHTVTSLFTLYKYCLQQNTRVYGFLAQNKGIMRMSCLLVSTFRLGNCSADL
jgi:hypothetical protein